MARRFLSPASAALLSTLVAFSTAACSSSEAPTSPSGSAEAPLEAGVTLKANAPALVGPTGGVRTDSLSPQFVAGQASARYVDDAPTFEYRFEVLTPGGQVVASSPKVSPGGDGQVRWALPFRLELDSPYQWRARAELGERVGPWASPASFLTLDYRGLNPRPADGRWPSNGPAVVAYIAAAWPEYLRPTGSLSQRIEHMEFLRDRIIEAGICGGLDVALNLKRGVGPHSHDAIAWRQSNGSVDVVDIANAFDAWGSTMSLHWAIVGGPPGYDRYRDHPGC